MQDAMRDWVNHLSTFQVWAICFVAIAVPVCIVANRLMDKWDDH